ncbi:hypothetical protein [Prevotella aff. ruminicola Tc2-24]|nr:hypothetical protein [Prevotella aff. ruminicola Tc2-24]
MRAKIKQRIINSLIGIFAISLISCNYDNDKKIIYMQLLPNHSVEKEDVSGKTWISDNDRYYLTFNENGTCVITNFPRNLSYEESYYDMEDRNDTTRITLYGRWYINYNTNDSKEVFIDYDIEPDRKLKYEKYGELGTRLLSIGMKYNPFGGENKYIPYFETMDDKEEIYFHTYSVVGNKQE